MGSSHPLYDGGFGSEKTMKKLLFTNVVYGPLYAEIFLNYHLKSMLDESNIPAFKDRCSGYVVYSDNETAATLLNHPNFQRLQKLIPVRIDGVNFPKGVETYGQKFQKRYGVLTFTFRQAVEEALKEDVLLSPMVADLVVAHGYLEKLFSRFDQGFDSVFVLPMRTAFEAMAPGLSLVPGALRAEDLFNFGFACLHPLWVACDWNSPRFTKLPFTLLWTNPGVGLLARSFSITPIAFEPTKEMGQTLNVIDVEIPSLCKNPYWATDWVECPIIGVEPLQCYYPPFKNEGSSDKGVAEWAHKTLHKSQFEWLRKPLYYPKADPAGWPKEREASDYCVSNILAARSRLVSDSK
jgi:hypothetical protein